ncbi:bifunctional 4-hydroxy-3-methylbut-2-enyl diphosphate reductase/30S ribosomal protein S1 [Metallumcola ferriviriculae]|uniref:4-hydroxy-3-methylbut-2-enyl diphosphate reductase n=1 Tax=Metallumcola ferriviriculae TaxID=3039180 RepID=A0AAU0URQ7_9FIRM|nr:bifunctional 4-hydroxy-3-methylbut-2-enyl diphosphate reductase/30S ribosomal protein S1 [Desulfitibacteraceae bacterium MK1]
MEIVLADYAGFCFGVKRALQMTHEASGRHNSLKSLGPLIHNPQVVEQLERQGVGVAHNTDEVQDDVVIIRSHGVSPDVLERLEGKAKATINATCPFVSRAQQLANRLTEEGYRTVVVGDKNHPEVIGIVGWTKGKAIVVETPEQAQGLDLHGEKVAVIAQTTQPEENFRAAVEILKKQKNDLVVHNTICHATRERQEAASRLARSVDLMVVVGGRNSANTKKLAKLCQATGTPTYHIEHAGELCAPWFQDIKRVGVTAGASTPEWIIEEVVEKMTDIKNEDINKEEMEQEGTAAETVEQEAEENAAQEAVPTEVEAAADEPTNPDDTAEDQDAVEAHLAENMPEIRRGSVITGTVVQVNDNGVMVDVGGKSEGIIPLNELSVNWVDQPDEVVNVGDEVVVEVLRVENEEGNPILSRKRLQRKQVWEKLEKTAESGEEIEAVVSEVVKGGLLVDVGIKGFVPASLAERGYVEDLSVYVGKTLRLKIIEMDRSKNKVVLSQKAILDEEFEKQRQETWGNLEEGEVRQGIVRRITDFGAFVDIGGVDGLLHVSELSWGRVDHPRDVLQEGQELEVKVLGVDREDERVSLGLKQLSANPWQTAAERYPEGTVVSGKVLRTAPFGAFVEVEPGIEGLVHISQLAHEHVEKTDDAVQPGDQVEVKVLGVDEDAQRMSLSIKETQPRPQRQAPSRPKAEPSKSHSYTQEEDSGIKIKDLVGDLSEMFEKRGEEE